ncbi:hypothetical protein ABZ299_12500 [Streptomyces sp. NPDC006184]|uniref:hypothetical protein n=1 Tax=Streptomyces sp. NPDC006184 TaxID=3155455 RepID=UPI0033B7508A
MPKHEIASKVLRTRKGSQVYVARDLSGQLSVHCSGCGCDEFKRGMAPALAGIVQHADRCSR